MLPFNAFGKTIPLTSGDTGAASIGFGIDLIYSNDDGVFYAFVKGSELAVGPGTAPDVAGGPASRVLSGPFASPLGIVPGAPGDLYLSKTGGPGLTLWVNETGGIGGWVPK